MAKDLANSSDLNQQISLIYSVLLTKTCFMIAHKFITKLRFCLRSSCIFYLVIQISIIHSPSVNVLFVEGINIESLIINDVLKV